MAGIIVREQNTYDNETHQEFHYETMLPGEAIRHLQRGDLWRGGPLSVRPAYGGYDGGWRLRTR